MSRSVLLLQLGRLDEALRDVEVAIAFAPQRGPSVVHRALIHAYRGDLAAARIDYDRAVALAPRTAKVWYLRGRFREHARDRRGALSDHGKALALDPGHIAALNHRANLRLDAGDREGAIEDLNEAIRRAPRDPGGFVHRGMARLSSMSADMQAAVADFRRAIALDATIWHAWSGLGQALVRLGQRDEGQAALQKALTLNPPPQARKRLQQMLRQLAGR